MSNLLNKDKKIQRVENKPPENTYNPNNIFTVEQTKKKEEKVKEKPTSIRLSKNSQQRLNTLVKILDKENVDQVLDLLLTNYESTLSKEKKKNYETLLKLLSKKI
ncbi:hypothetical protein [Streptomyces sp. NPDC057131]|uniref:hypothetical protein n=1 Tax=Streptomyces sp. NPDC057131 TaxID=3346027 RepID=UPI0036D35E07